jgi:hypothetical protein
LAYVHGDVVVDARRVGAGADRHLVRVVGRARGVLDLDRDRRAGGEVDVPGVLGRRAAVDERLEDGAVGLTAGDDGDVVGSLTMRRQDGQWLVWARAAIEEPGRTAPPDHCCSGEGEETGSRTSGRAADRVREAIGRTNDERRLAGCERRRRNGPREGRERKHRGGGARAKQRKQVVSQAGLKKGATSRCAWTQKRGRSPRGASSRGGRARSH